MSTFIHNPKFYKKSSNKNRTNSPLSLFSFPSAFGRVGTSLNQGAFP